MIIFEEQYDGDSWCDIGRDVYEAIDGNYNPLVNKIPCDELGFAKGILKITIEWKDE